MMENLGVLWRRKGAFLVRILMHHLKFSLGRRHTQQYLELIIGSVLRNTH